MVIEKKNDTVCFEGVCVYLVLQMFCSSPCSRRLLGSRRCSSRDGVKETQTERR